MGEGRPTLLTREPGGSAGAEILRGLLLSGTHRWAATAEVHLHFAVRAEHLACSVEPALEAGMVVVCDRFADSTMAYQGHGLGADRALIAGLTALLPRRPDLTLLLRVSPVVAAARLVARGRGKDRYELLDEAFHARVAAGFEEIAAAEPRRVVPIDADGPLEEVQAALRAAVQARLC